MTDADLTELDRAHARMQAAPDDDMARLRFHEHLADTELFLLLDRDAQGDVVDPKVLEIDDGRFVLVFDREQRLAAFAGQVAPMVALSGRALTRMLAGQGIGLALNMEVAPSAMLVGAGAVDWLADLLATGPVATVARPVGFAAPKGLPDALVLGLDRKLSMAGGLAEAALLAAVTYDDGARGHLLAFVGALPEAQAALAAAVAETLVFSGIAAGALDVAFLAATDRRLERLARVALRFDLPRRMDPAAPLAPGMDPEKPPKLR